MTTPELTQLEQRLWDEYQKAIQRADEICKEWRKVYDELNPDLARIRKEQHELAGQTK